MPTISEIKKEIKKAENTIEQIFERTGTRDIAEIARKSSPLFNNWSNENSKIIKLKEQLKREELAEENQRQAIAASEAAAAAATPAPATPAAAAPAAEPQAEPPAEPPAFLNSRRATYKKVEKTLDTKGETELAKLQAEIKLRKDKLKNPSLSLENKKLLQEAIDRKEEQIGRLTTGGKRKKKSKKMKKTRKSRKSRKSKKYKKGRKTRKHKF